MSLLFVKLSCLLILVYYLQFSSAGNNVTDRLALYEFKTKITFDPLGILNSWNDSLHFCQWHGVTCGRRHRRVTSLDLSSSKLTGTLSPFVGNLSFLRHLILVNNSFIGTIPSEVGRLHRLLEVSVSYNSFGGEIPANLSCCSSLIWLNVEYNNLVGEIPPEFGSLKYLYHMDLEHNNLTGVIPSSLGNLTSLFQLYMSGNNLIGKIPESLGRLNKLLVLALGVNKLSGEVPPSIFNLSLLTQLDLGVNQLEGIFPVHIGIMLPNLQFFSIRKNKFTGSIPSSLGNLTSLSVLQMENNNIIESIPESLGSLNQLSFLSLGGNKLSGVVPHSIFNFSLLTTLDLGVNQLGGIIPQHIGTMLPNLLFFSIFDNNFTGSIPASINNCTSLQVLQLGNNNLQGRVPCLHNFQMLGWFSIANNYLGLGQLNDLDFVSCLANSTLLTHLSIETNNFQGAFPNILCNFSSLSYLTMQDNKIFGEIPSCIENLANLQVFGAFNNKLSGIIPFNIGNLQNLRKLSFTSNRLSGLIPSSIGNLTQLLYLSLGDNNLTGHIPSTLGDCRNLQQLDISQNILEGTIPLNFFNLSLLTTGLDLSQNPLIGSLPKEVGQLKNLVILNITYTGLSGEIPSTLGECLMLEYLYLNGNGFQGVIPPSFAALKGLQVLDLSWNNLSGKFPNFLVDFPLRILNLSYNDLQGEVPTGGVFNNISRLSIVGNNGLCGGIHELNLPPCYSNKDRKRIFGGKTRLIIAIVSGVFGVGMLVTFVSLNVFCLRKRKIAFEGKTETSLLNLSYGDIFKATNGFSSENVLGSGTFGTVYKAILDQGITIVAIKMFNLEQRGGYKSFMAECQVLKNVRHRNLLKVITACSSVDYKGKDVKALVYEYMPNGSLENWLHPNGVGNAEGTTTPVRRLSLLHRVNIAVDVAFGLEYLHHHSGASIIHCDLKPSNVLLDEEIVGHVGDFGLAKFISNGISSSHANESSSIGVRGTIGYAPPEYGLGNEPSTQGDVYSFGILLLEMFTGKKPTDDRFKDDLSLHGYVKAVWPERVMEIFDHVILEDIVGEDQINTNTVNNHTNYLLRTGKSRRMLEAVSALLGIALSCSVEFPWERMDMRDVVAELSTIRNKLLGTHLPRQRQIPAGDIDIALENE